MKIIDFVPPILLAGWRRIKPEHYPISPLLKQNMNGHSMVLMGNGPSLNRSIELYGEEIMKHDRLVVNYFAMSDYFERFKPNYYLLVDPMFYRETNFKETARKLISTLIEKTTWPMCLCVPEHAKDSENIRRVREGNPNISLTYFDTTGRNFRRITKFEAWDRNITCPPVRNAMNVGLYLSLFWGYSETYLIGIDMTALEEIRIDQDTNELYSIDTHFYDSAKLCVDKNRYDKRNRKILSDEWTLHEYLQAFATIFEGFYELGEYAKYKRLKVYNACEYSWVNYFERRKLK